MIPVDFLKGTTEEMLTFEETEVKHTLMFCNKFLAKVSLNCMCEYFSTFQNSASLFYWVVFPKILPRNLQGGPSTLVGFHG